MITKFKLFEGYIIYDNLNLDDLIYNITKKITIDIKGKILENSDIIRHLSFNTDTGYIEIYITRKDSTKKTGISDFYYILGNMKINIHNNKIILNIVLDPYKYVDYDLFDNQNDRILNISDIVNIHNDISDNIEEGLRVSVDFFLNDEKYNYIRAGKDHGLI